MVQSSRASLSDKRRSVNFAEVGGGAATSERLKDAEARISQSMHSRPSALEVVASASLLEGPRANSPGIPKAEVQENAQTLSAMVAGGVKAMGATTSPAAGGGRNLQLISGGDFLPAGLIGTMVNLASGDAASSGMLAVRHARLIQKLILASGDEATKTNEKWQKKLASVKAGPVELTVMNDMRRAGHKIRSKRRGAFLERLAAEMDTHNVNREEGLFGQHKEKRGSDGSEGRNSLRPSSESALSSDSSSSSTSLSDSSSASDAEDVSAPGLTTKKRFSNSLAVPRRNSESSSRRTSTVDNMQGTRRSSEAPPGTGANGEGRQHVKLRMSKKLSNANLLAGDVKQLARRTSTEAEAAAPHEARRRGTYDAAARRISATPASQAQEDQGTPEGRSELTPAQRAKLPEVFGISKFRHHRTIICGGHWQEPANSVKRFHHEVAERLGLVAEEGDWDPSEVYKLSVPALEKLAHQKAQRERERAATYIQSRYRGYLVKRPILKIMQQRREALKMLKPWLMHMLRRKELRLVAQVTLRRHRMAIKIQANWRRKVVQMYAVTSKELREVGNRMDLLQEQIYPAEARQRDREAAETERMMEEEVHSRAAEMEYRREVQEVRAAGILQPHFRRFLKGLRQRKLAREEQERLAQEAEEAKRQKRLKRGRAPAANEDSEQGKHHLGKEHRQGTGPRLEQSPGSPPRKGSKELEAGEKATSAMGKALSVFEAMGRKGAGHEALDDEDGVPDSARSLAPEAQQHSLRPHSEPWHRAILPPVRRGLSTAGAGARGGPARGALQTLKVPVPVLHEPSRLRK